MLINLLNKNLIKNCCDKIKDLDYYYNFWKSYLYERVIRLFEWENLPFPQKELEMRLLTLGYCGIVPKENSFMVVRSNMWGVTEYFDEFTNISWATPIKNGTGQSIINKNHIVCNNDSMRIGCEWLVDAYALKLAHCDLTIINSLVNKRADSVATANSSNIMESIKLFFKNLYNGKQTPISDTVYDSLKFNQLANDNEHYLKTFELQKNLLSQFFEAFGIASQYEKRGNMIQSEVTRNDNLLTININDMYKCRLEIADKINKGYGVNVSVKCLVDNTIDKGGNDNDN